MNRCLSIAAALLLLVVSSSRVASAADQSPSDSVRPGMTVAITDDAGKVTEGRIKSISDDVIRVARRKSIEEISLTRIIRIDKRDTLQNGAINGLIVGASLGVATGIAMRADGQGNALVVAWALVGQSLLYSGIGTAIDAMFNHERTLYERGQRHDRETRIAPIVGPGVAGGMLRVSW